MLKIGIVGLPNVGKSTLFNTLTKASVPAENYPFCTIDPSVGVVGVPDSRLQKLSELQKSERTIPAAVEFVDIAGLVEGASTGEGLGNQFLANIRETDAILQVVRFFDDPSVLHVGTSDVQGTSDVSIEPYKDIEIINLELALADAEQVQRRRDKLVRDIKANDKKAMLEDAALEKLEVGFASGRLALHAGLDDEEKKFVAHLSLLTMKPILYVLNTKSGTPLADDRARRAFELIESLGSQYIFVDVATERELNDVADTDRESFRHELGVSEDGLANLIRGAYDTLSLISFFTTGPDETRAWTIPAGSAAPVAGAAIHTDFRDKFIRAEVIEWQKLLAAGSYAAAREKGLVRTEGREYLVKDGDVVEFLHG